VGCPNFDVTTGKILAIILAHDSKFSGLTKYFADIFIRALTAVLASIKSPQYDRNSSKQSGIETRYV